MKTHGIDSKNRIYICCHHKVGTILRTSVFGEVCSAFGTNYKIVCGYADAIFDDYSVVLLSPPNLTSKACRRTSEESISSGIPVMS